MPSALPPFVQETLVSLCVDVHPPFMTSWSESWKEFVRGLRLERMRKKLRLELAEGDSGEIIPFLCTLFVYNKRNTCLGSRYKFFFMFMTFMF